MELTYIFCLFNLSINILIRFNGLVPTLKMGSWGVPTCTGFLSRQVSRKNLRYFVVKESRFGLYTNFLSKILTGLSKIIKKNSVFTYPNISACIYIPFDIQLTWIFFGLFWGLFWNDIVSLGPILEQFLIHENSNNIYLLSKCYWIYSNIIFMNPKIISNFVKQSES